jgi:hypothetical protein
MQIYLYLNAVLYGVFALWCTVMPTQTATNLGYLSLASGGRSEYLVIYGGLQLGLALIFWQAARIDAYQRFGVLIAVLLYAPIVLYRVVTVAKQWPVASLTIGTGCLEACLLAVALWLYVKGT